MTTPSDQPPSAASDDADELAREPQPGAPPGDLPADWIPPSGSGCDVCDDEPIPPLPPKRNVRNLLLSVLGMVVLIALLQAGPLSHLTDHINDIKDFVQAFGAVGPLIYVLMAIVLTPLGVPRLAISLLAGTLFGVAYGLPLALVGTVLGAWTMFAGSRYFRRSFGFDNHKLARSRFGHLLANPRFSTIFVMRQMPVHGMLTNVVLGLSRCTHRDYLVGTFLGFLPQCLMAVLLGSGVGKDDKLLAGLQTGLAILVFVVSALLTWRMLRLRRATP